MDRLVQTFVDLAEIDEVHPNESNVLAYVKKRLDDANVSYVSDNFGNIIAYIPGKSNQAIGICGHMDIATPLNGRKIVIDSGKIATDGTGLLGGDDKTAVAAMLELAAELHESNSLPQQSVEMLFLRGEEAGLLGAIRLDVNTIHSKQIIVLDWTGRVNRIITKSPAYFKLDITYHGKPAHPAEWQQGINAGAALMTAASQLQQGEYAPGVTFNIGTINIGEARNQVPGLATLQAEFRSHDVAAVTTASHAVLQHFIDAGKAAGVRVISDLQDETVAYTLNQTSPLLAHVSSSLSKLGLDPAYDETFGCFDGNILAGKGLDVVIMGAAYYNPHSTEEYVDIDQLQEMYRFIKTVAAE